MNEAVPRQLSESVRLARAAQAKEGFSASRKAIRALIEAHPEEGDLYAILAVATQWSGEPEAAKKLVDEQLSQRPGAGLYAAGAEIAHIDADFERAGVMLNQAQALDPDHFLTLRQLSQQMLFEAKFEGGIAALRRSLQLYPEDPDAYSSLVVAHQAAGDIEGMDRLLKEAPEWFVGTAQYHNRMGMAAAQKRQLGEGEHHLRLAVAACPEGASYWSHLAMVLGHLAKFDESERAAKFALEINPLSPIALRALAKVASHQGNTAAADEYERKASAAIPALKSSGQYTKANALVHAGKYGEAAGVYRQLLSQPHGNHNRYAYKILPGVLADGGMWEEAGKELAAARSVLGSDPLLDIVEFRILEAGGKDSDAQEALEMLLAKNPIPPEFLAHAIRFLYGHGQAERGEKLIRSEFENYQGPPAAIANSIMALEQAGQKELARELHTLARRRYPDEDLFKLISVGFSAQDGDLIGALRQNQNLPPNLRARIQPAGSNEKPGCFGVLARMLFGVKK